MKISRYIRYIAGVIVGLSLIPLVALAQSGVGESVRIIPQLERSAILIGEQVKLNIRVVYPQSEVMRLVLPEDTLVSGVEIIGTELVDSVKVNDRLQEMVYDVVITSFDSANYQLSNIAALVGDSLYSSEEDLSLVVNTVPVDLNQPDKYADIKGQWKPKFVWTDYLIYIYILLGILLLGLLLFFLLRYLKRRKSVVQNNTFDVPLLDPYNEAIQSIEALRGESLLEMNKTKEYYTELTDILRRYLFRVYGIHTLEGTSSEILESFKQVVGRDRMYSELSKILQTADLAKFAKYQPDEVESMGLLSASVAFIEEHKPKSKEEGGDEV